MRGHWKRLELSENLNKLLSLLKEHGELQYSDLKEKLGVSDPTLTNYIKELEKQGKIEAFFKPEDRRQRWYRIRHESQRLVDAELGKYRTIRFIEGIVDPIYLEEISKDGSKGMSLFSSVPPSENRDDWEADLRKKTQLGLLLRFFPKLKKDCDLALVITVKGKRN